MLRLNIVDRKEKAQGMVEFALILPILLLVILGIVEFGRLLFFYSSVTSASREGARYGSAVGEVNGASRYEDCDGIRSAALKAGSFAGIENDDIAIQYDDGVTQKDAICPPSSKINLADRVVVTVVGNFRPITPLIDIFFPEDGIDITSTTARTIIKEVGVKGTPAPTATLPGAPTATPTDTPTATATFTNTPTETPTETPTPTSTLEVTDTPGPTATPTNTPENTPTNTPPPCPSPNGLSIGSDGTKVTFSISNPAQSPDYEYTIDRIYIDWSNSAKLDKISFTTTLSISKINNGSGEYSVDPGWTGPFAETEGMTFTFKQAVTSPVNVQVTFRNCEVISGSQ